MTLPRLMIAGFAALASVVYASPCKPSSATVVTTSSAETATAASGSSSIDTHSFSSLFTTTSVENSIMSESLSSFLSSYTTTASSDSVSSDSSSFLSTDTFSSQPTSTLQATSSAEPTTTTEESKTTTEQPTTTTTDMTTSTEATTTISQCNSVDPLTTVALANPTPVFDDSLDHDDDFASIVLPFGIGPSGATTIYISSNGIVSLGSGADAYVNEDLPSNSIPNIAYLPYWDDLYLSRTHKNTIVYEVFDGKFGTEATIEWLVTKSGSSSIFHFDISFLQNQPNAVRFRYYTTPSKGSSATVGIQDQDNGKVIKIEYNTANSIADGTAIIMDTESGSQVMTTFDNTECGKDADRNADS
ncbi:hypothetical protein FSST1_000221 [Fusarium sambucinum]